MSLTWEQTAAAAYSAARAAAVTVQPVFASLSGSDHSLFGCALAEDLCALVPLPAFDTCSMDGWAVSGPGPWEVRGQLLAGSAGSAQPSLAPGQAVVVGTGSMIPAGADGLLRSEWGVLDRVLLQAVPDVTPDLDDVRRAGSEAAAGEVLAVAGSRITPPLAGLAAAAGHDQLVVIPRPVVDVLVIGDELVTSGQPSDGRVRDSLGIQLPGWIHAGGGEPGAIQHLADDAGALSDAISRSDAGILVTTGGSSRGRGDHVRPVLEALGARMLVDGVRLRPGGPMKLAQVPGGRLLVALPGNPLAALAGVVTLLWPVLAGLGGAAAPGTETAVAAEPFPGHAEVASLVPVTGRSRIRAVDHRGPAMLRGITSATALGVVPPGGVGVGDPIEVVALPWEANRIQPRG